VTPIAGLMAGRVPMEDVSEKVVTVDQSLENLMADLFADVVSDYSFLKFMKSDNYCLFSFLINDSSRMTYVEITLLLVNQ